MGNNMLKQSSTNLYWAQWKSQRMWSGVLYRLRKSEKKQMVVPKCLHKAVLQLLSLPTSGHFGITNYNCEARVLLATVQPRYRCTTCDQCIKADLPCHTCGVWYKHLNQCSSSHACLKYLTTVLQHRETAPVLIECDHTYWCNTHAFAWVLSLYCSWLEPTLYSGPMNWLELALASHDTVVNEKYSW